MCLDNNLTIRYRIIDELSRIHYINYKRNMSVQQILTEHLLFKVLC